MSSSPQEPKPPTDAATALIAEAQRLIDLTLRYIAAGGSAVLVFGVIQGKNFEFLTTSKQQELSVWLLLFFVVVLGLAIYTVHRALLYRFITFVMYVLAGLLRRPRLASPWAVERLLWEEQDNRKGVRGANLAAFAAQVHFLYCSAWGTLGAVLVAATAAIPLGPAARISAAAGVVLLAAALVHDWKLVRQQLEILAKDSREEGG